MDLKKLWNDVATFTSNFGKKQPQEIISPLPAKDTMTEGLEHYYKMDQMKQDWARRSNQANAGQPTPTPQTLKYPEWMANGPNEKQKRAVQIIRQTKPDYKGSDSDIIALYNKHGERLLQGLTRGPQPLQRGPVAQGPTPTPIPQYRAPSTPNPTPVPGVRVADEVEQFIVDTILPITREYGIPDAVAAGQFAQEGRFKGVGAELNNYYNVGFTDSLAESGQYHQVPRYESPEAGIEAYARFITGQANDDFYANGVDGSRSGKIGKKQLQEIAKKYKNDPVGFLQAIGPMYSSQGHEYYQNIMQTPEFRRFYYK